VNVKDFSSDLEACGIQINEETWNRMLQYLNLVFKWNRKINLTAIPSRKEFFRFHLLEAFWAAESFQNELKCFADIGTGVGLPGLAIKIFRPSVDLCLMEQNLKRTMFLRTICRDLDLDIKIYHGKAENFSSWNRFRCATIRALKPSREILEILKQRRIPLLVFRGSDLTFEVQDFKVCRQARFPLSRNRWVSLLLPVPLEQR